MKLTMICFECLAQIGIQDIPYLMLHSPADDGRYTYTCPNGHNGITVLQQDRFQLLFQIGIHALVDGYPREAVTDFTASLERFYEYFFKFSCRSQQISDADERSAWAMVSRQSERQLGLFFATYLMLFGRSPPTLSNKQVEFRNSVVHKGQIPTESEAIAYGEAVAGLIQPILQKMHSAHPEVLQQLDIERIISAASGQQAATMSYPTFLSYQEVNQDLREAIRQAALPPWNYR